MNVKLTCPKCGQHYDVELEPGVIYDDMDCQNCGGKIPVSAAPPPAAQKTPPPPTPKKQTLPPRVPEYPSVESESQTEQKKIQKQDERKASAPTTSAPQKMEKTRPTYNNARANFFYGLSVLFFMLGHIVAFVDNGKYIGFSAYCGGATIIFLLNAIYFRISAR